MDLFESAFIDFWKHLNEQGVRYILVGGFATNFHGYQRYTGDVDIWIEDTLENRMRLRKAYKAYGMGDFELFETIQFVPGWVDFPLQNGVRLDIMTTMKGVESDFEACLQKAPHLIIGSVNVPVLHINELIANKKGVNRPKDQLDVVELEKIKDLQKKQDSGTKL
jgi:hypothetical protein